MRKLKLLTHCTLLATTPSLLAYPQNYSPLATFQIVNHGYLQDTEEWIQPTTYDEIVQMLEDLESGALEIRYSPMQLERVNEYLTFLAKAGQLESTVTEAYGHLRLPMQESIKLFDNAQKFLKPYKGFMPETQVRELIQKTGIPTFPRPKGIPDNFRVKLSSNGVGMKYVHPTNEQTYIRGMPGKPHSKYPHHQKPYVVQMKNGMTLDKSGNVVLREAPEAHIPIEEFVFIGDVF